MRFFFLASLALALAACNSGGSSGCGTQGQACCANESCMGTLVCTGIAGNAASFKCAHCGNPGEACCLQGSQCVTGSICRMTVDTGPHCSAVDGGTDAGGDAGGMDCTPSGACSAGPSCGGACCGAKEWCDTSGGTPTCRCGSGSACAGSSACVSNLGTAQCGFTCCPPTCPP